MLVVDGISLRLTLFFSLKSKINVININIYNYALLTTNFERPILTRTV